MKLEQKTIKSSVYFPIEIKLDFFKCSSTFNVLIILIRGEHGSILFGLILKSDQATTFGLENFKTVPDRLN